MVKGDKMAESQNKNPATGGGDERKIHSYEVDGEKITYETPEQERKAADFAAAQKAVRNPFACLGLAQITTGTFPPPRGI